MTQQQVNVIALEHWYNAHPAILRLWVMQQGRADDGSPRSDLRVILMLQPSGDGDETSPAWMAHSGIWATELERMLARTVELECLERALGEHLMTEGDASLLASFSWRDSTLLQSDSIPV
jgi:hypothetical protein